MIARVTYPLPDHVKIDPAAFAPELFHDIPVTMGTDGPTIGRVTDVAVDPDDPRRLLLTLDLPDNLELLAGAPVRFSLIPTPAVPRA
jgi:hypothetical protein